ncbi:class I SAM-dependent methyltransferase [Lentzea tibetensis]|nr:class I SAM-dependent methyltransferase [Lentzea tibetensis]
MNGKAVDADAFDRFEAASWGRRTDGYEQFFVSLTSRTITPLLDAAGVGPGTRVLDIASGPGHVAAACAARGASVTGLDIAPEMVALAGRRHPGIRFERADAQRLPFPEASADAVVGNFAILHVGRPELVAGEAARVLAPGGTLALSTWDVPARCRLLGVFLDAIGEVGAVPPPDVPVGPPFFRFADDDECTRLLTGAGLTGVGVQTITFGHRVGTAAELWEGMIGGTVRTRALVLSQPDDVQGRIRGAFERITAEYATPDGLDLPVSVKIVSGVRP